MTPPHTLANEPTDGRDRWKRLYSKQFLNGYPLANGPTDDLPGIRKKAVCVSGAMQSILGGCPGFGGCPGAKGLRIARRLGSITLPASTRPCRSWLRIARRLGSITLIKIWETAYFKLRIARRLGSIT